MGIVRTFSAWWSSRRQVATDSLAAREAQKLLHARKNERCVQSLEPCAHVTVYGGYTHFGPPDWRWKKWSKCGLYIPAY